MRCYFWSRKDYFFIALLFRRAVTVEWQLAHGTVDNETHFLGKKGKCFHAASSSCAWWTDLNVFRWGNAFQGHFSMMLLLLFNVLKSETFQSWKVFENDEETNLLKSIFGWRFSLLQNKHLPSYSPSIFFHYDYVSNHEDSHLLRNLLYFYLWVSDGLFPTNQFKITYHSQY